METIHFSIALNQYIALKMPDDELKIADFRIFLIAPFDSKRDFEPGEFEKIDDNKVFSLLKKSVTGIEACSKVPFTEPFADIVYPSKSKDGRNIGVLEIRLNDIVYPSKSKDGRNIGVLEIRLNDIVNSGVQIRFENNRIYLYEWGTGVLVTQASVTPHDISSTSALRQLERKIKEIFRQEFLQIVRAFISEFGSYTRDMKFEKMDLRIPDTSETNLAWVHTIYCLWGTDYFKADMGKMGWELKNEIVVELANLLDQVPEDMSPVPERYVFYGWGSSLIIAKHDTLKEQLGTIKRIIFLMQITQNISLSLSQLESILSEKIYKIKPDLFEIKKGSKTYDAQHSEIMKELSEIQKARNSTFRFLEQFHHSTNPLIQNKERLLQEKLRNQWKLDDLEASIINKLNILEGTLKEKSQFLYSKEQHDSLVKQDTLSKLFLALTLASIIGVLSQLVLLDPVNSLLNEEDWAWSHFVWAILISVVIIALFIIIYEFAKIRNKIPTFGSRSNGKGSVPKTDS